MAPHNPRNVSFEKHESRPVSFLYHPFNVIMNIRKAFFGA